MRISDTAPILIQYTTWRIVDVSDLLTLRYSSDTPSIRSRYVPPGDDVEDDDDGDDEVDLRPEKVGRVRVAERETRSEVELKPW